MTTINTYLTFNGNCLQAFTFYQSVFGGEFAHVGKYDEMPDDPRYPVTDSDKDRIMHISLPISKETVLMGSDAGGEWAKEFHQGNNFSVSIHTDSQAEADRLFEGLSQYGKVVMQLNETFWGSYFGMLTDQFGIQWMVSAPSKKEED